MDELMQFLDVTAAPSSRSTYEAGMSGISVTKEFNLKTENKRQDPESPFRD